MFVRTRLNITIYVHCLSCLIWEDQPLGSTCGGLQSDSAMLCYALDAKVVHLPLRVPDREHNNNSNHDNHGVTDSQQRCDTHLMFQDLVLKTLICEKL
jgi:hypothetical protein